MLLLSVYLIFICSTIQKKKLTAVNILYYNTYIYRHRYIYYNINKTNKCKCREQYFEVRSPLVVCK